MGRGDRIAVQAMPERDEEATGMIVNLVTGLIAVLFLAVLGLLGYGVHAFSRRDGSAEPPTKVNMGREVLWTGLASLLLFGFFLYAHP